MGWVAFPALAAYQVFLHAVLRRPRLPGLGTCMPACLHVLRAGMQAGKKGREARELCTHHGRTGTVLLFVSGCP